MATNYIQSHISDFIITTSAIFGEMAIDLAKGIGINSAPFSQVLRGRSRANRGGVIKLGQQI
jgi:hypothetical protein